MKLKCPCNEIFDPFFIELIQRGYLHIHFSAIRIKIGLFKPKL